MRHLLYFHFYVYHLIHTFYSSLIIICHILCFLFHLPDCFYFCTAQYVYEMHHIAYINLLCLALPKGHDLTLCLVSDNPGRRVEGELGFRHCTMRLIDCCASFQFQE